MINPFYPDRDALLQDVPSTDIYVADIHLVDTMHQISNIRNLTRRNGYDNQPSFSRTGRYLIYNSMRDGQTDLFRYDFTSGETVQFTSSAESEYSPQWTPDNSGFSSVVVEEDGTQRLWFYTLDGQPVQPLLERVEPVGYYSWLDTTRVALFVLGDPPTLRIADIRTGLVRTVAENIGRSLQTMPGSNTVAWLDKNDPQNWMIRMYDADTRKISSLITALPESEDFTWTAYGTLIMARHSIIFEWDPLGTAGWTEIADLSTSGIRNITRLAISPSGNRIAIVAGR
ncbi:MAG: TolB family protein [Cyclonatronaceae bacterium]